MYGLNLERRILDKILYEVDCSDIPRKLLPALTIYNLKVSHEKKLLTQFITTHYTDNICGTGGGTTLNSFRNTVNKKTPITVEQKAQQFPRISTHLMMAE
jgi:hypothetical protein